MVSGSNRSGAMYAIVPTMWSVRVWWLVASSARAMPKSMTLIPPRVNSTFPGLRSRWITPAPWIAVSAVAVPTATLCRFANASGPYYHHHIGEVGPVAAGWSRASGSIA